MFMPILAEMPNPVEHVIDKPLIEVDWFGYPGWLVSNVTVMLVLCGIITAVLMICAPSASPPARPTPSPIFTAQGLHANIVEAICLYLRNEIFKPALGDATDRYTPFLWTFFWFILVCNAMGLVPLSDLSSSLGFIIHHPIGHHGHGIGGTATQSIWVTGGLALVSFLVINISGIRKDAPSPTSST